MTDLYHKEHELLELFDVYRPSDEAERREVQDRNNEYRHWKWQQRRKEQ